MRLKIFSRFLLTMVILFFTNTGFSSSSLREEKRGEGSTEISGSIVNIVRYQFSENDPSKITNIYLQVVSTPKDDSPDNVLLSLDDGITWISCISHINSTWICQFQSGDEPSVASLTTIRVIVY